MPALQLRLSGDLGILKLPEPPGVPCYASPSGWISQGGELVFSGSADLGATYGVAEYDYFYQLGQGIGEGLQQLRF
jgi:hypothetical protein